MHNQRIVAEVLLTCCDLLSSPSNICDIPKHRVGRGWSFPILVLPLIDWNRRLFCVDDAVVLMLGDIRYSRYDTTFLLNT